MMHSTRNYFEFIKPRETVLLGFTGIATATIAAQGSPSLYLLAWIALAVLIGSAGSNGTTNFLDRAVDAKMRRTRHRPLPSGRIEPPVKSLILSVGLLIIGLAIAWWLDPWCFVIGGAGSLLAVIARKSSITHILGIGSSCSPALIGWVAVKHTIDPTIMIISLMIALWVPIHVWSVMISYRDDYLQAGVKMFPLTAEVKLVARILLVLTVLLFLSSLALFFTGYFSTLYLVAAVILGLIVLTASLRFAINSTQTAAFKVYKLSAFPFLGLLLIAMCLDQWIRS